MRSIGLVLLVLTVTVLCSSCSSSEPEGRMDRDPEAFFLRLDKDRDGRLSWDEFREMPSRIGTPEERFQKLDTDSDGYVSLDEFLAAREENRRPGEGRPGGGRHGGGRSGGGRF